MNGHDSFSFVAMVTAKIAFPSSFTGREDAPAEEINEFSIAIEADHAVRTLTESFRRIGKIIEIVLPNDFGAEVDFSVKLLQAAAKLDNLLGLLRRFHLELSDVEGQLCDESLRLSITSFLRQLTELFGQSENGVNRSHSRFSDAVDLLRVTQNIGPDEYELEEKLHSIALKVLEQEAAQVFQGGKEVVEALEGSA